MLLVHGEVNVVRLMSLCSATKFGFSPAGWVGTVWLRNGICHLQIPNLEAGYRALDEGDLQTRACTTAVIQAFQGRNKTRGNGYLPGDYSLQFDN